MASPTCVPIRSILPPPPLLLALVIGLVAACGSGDPVPTGPPASATPPPVVQTPELLARQGELDGQLVAVRGFFLTDMTTHRVCDAILESYPPQCGGATLNVIGQVPAPVLAQLESTKDQPDLAQVAWGQVEIRGILGAARGDAPASITLLEMRVIGS